MQNEHKKYIIFGAGRYGEEALFYYGIKNVAFFCDNRKEGKVIHGIEIIGFSKLQQIWQDYQVVLAVSNFKYKEEMQKQLETYRISYEYFSTLNSVLEENNFTGEYEFVNRSKNKEKLLMVLAGYKEYLWEDVFDRVKEYVPEDVDICIMTAGYESVVLKEMCARQEWSYLYTEENKLSLTQNITIKLHPVAKWIYKMDEDIFITPGLFEEVMNTYLHVMQGGKHAIGFVAPVMAVNHYGYRRVLERLNAVEEYEKKFGQVTYGQGQILSNPDAAEYLWDKTLPINEFAKKIENVEDKYSICYHRYSIGFILMERTIWEGMGGFKIAPEGVLGIDEEYLCEWCMNRAYAFVIAERAYAAHFSYGLQTEHMKEVYEKRREEFRN